MKLSIRSLAAVFAFIVWGAVFSCTSPKTETDEVVATEEAAPAPEEETSAAQDVMAGLDTVVIYQMKFNPENIKVKKGATVVWINKDIVVHDVTEKDTLWTSGNIPNDGKTAFTKVVDESFDYFCSIHPTMTASVTVE